jgi:hypothetical protein
MASTSEPATEVAVERPQSGVVLNVAVGGAVVLLCGIALIAFLQGPHPFDPAKYFETGVHFPHVALDLWTLRIGLVGLVYGAVLIFGPSEASLYAVPIATGLLLAAAVYTTMLVLFRERLAASAAALVTTLNPVYLRNASSILPDTTATATFAAGFLCLILGGEGPWQRESVRRRDLVAAAAGVLFGATYLVREFSPILLPAVVAAVLLLRYPPRRILVLAGAALATAALELLYGVARAGDPFLHAHELFERGAEGAVRVQERLDAGQMLPLLLRLVVSWRSGWLLLFLLVLFGVALAVTRDRRLWILAAWSVSFWVVMTGLGLVSLRSGTWIVNITNVRYWYPILPPIVMGGFGGLVLLGRRFAPVATAARIVPIAAAALMLVLLVPGLAEFRSCASRDGWKTDPRGRWVDLRGWFGTPEADRYDQLWTDWRTHRLVPAYTATTFGRELWGGELDAFQKLDGATVAAAERANRVILIDKNHLWRDVPRPGASLHALRDDWAPIFVSGDGNTLVLAHDPPAAERAAAPGIWWVRGPTADVPAPGTCGLGPYERGS